MPWIESPFFESELKKAALNPEMEALMRHYAGEGYVVFDPGVSLGTIDAAVKAFAPTYAEQNVTRIQDAWSYNPAAKAIATAPKVLRVLCRREPIPFQTLNFNVGTQQKTHSDMIHFSSIPQRCGVWIAMEDVHAVTHYCFKDCVYYPPLLSDMPLNRALAQQHEGYDVRIVLPESVRKTLKAASKLLPGGGEHGEKETWRALT